MGSPLRNVPCLRPPTALLLTGDVVLHALNDEQVPIQIRGLFANRSGPIDAHSAKHALTLFPDFLRRFDHFLECVFIDYADGFSVDDTLSLDRELIEGEWHQHSNYRLRPRDDYGEVLHRVLLVTSHSFAKRRLNPVIHGPDGWRLNKLIFPLNVETNFAR